MNCEQVKADCKIVAVCCDVCHAWAQDEIVRGYQIRYNETIYEVCCKIMEQLQSRLGECNHGVFDLRV